MPLNHDPAYLAEIGSRGGRRTTARKALTARTNGAKPVRPGSRPRGQPKKPLTPPASVA